MYSKYIQTGIFFYFNDQYNFLNIDYIMNKSKSQTR